MTTPSASRPAPGPASSDRPGTDRPGGVGSAPAGPRAAAPWARVRAQAAFEAVTLLRNGEQLLVSIVLPLLALIALVRAPWPELPDPRVDAVAPGILALAVVSTAFTGQAIQLAFDRRHGVLRMLGTTPLGRSGLLLGKALAVLAVLLVQLIVLGGAAIALGWRPVLAGLPAALLLLVVGAAAFVALALVVGGTLRPEAVLALANLLWVLLLGAGGLVLPAGGPWGALTRWLPSGALGDGLRAALGEGRLDLLALLVLTIWAAGLGALASRLLRWSE